MVLFFLTWRKMIGRGWGSMPRQQNLLIVEQAGAPGFEKLIFMLSIWNGMARVEERAAEPIKMAGPPLPSFWSQNNHGMETAETVCRGKNAVFSQGGSQCWCRNGPFKRLLQRKKCRDLFSNSLMVTQICLTSEEESEARKAAYLEK